MNVSYIILGDDDARDTVCSAMYRQKRVRHIRVAFNLN